jgi:hypothetical protein
VKGVAAALLVFEGIVVALAIPLATSVSDVSASVAVPVGLALMLVCFAAAGVVRRPYGDRVAGVVQVLVLATGFVVPAMFLLGVIFAGLWVLSIVLGRKMAADLRVRQAREGR